MIKTAIGLFVVCHLAYTFQIQPRIVNGKASEPNQFPYFVYINTNVTDETEQQFCGGSLISDRWIVTAGHCLIDDADVVIYLGMNSNGSQYVHRMQIDRSKLFIHPNYNDTSLENDIGLIELPGKLEESSMVRPVNLPTDCDGVLGDENVIVVGKGPSSLEGEEDKALRYSHMTTLSEEACYEKVKKPHFDSKSIVCTITKDYLLNGDSGGPLLRESDDSLIGIVSFGQYYLDRTLLEYRANQVYTNIYYHFDWISQQTGIQLPKCI